MKIDAIKTQVVRTGDDLFAVLEAIPQLQERSVVAITSKVVALCEENVVERREGTREEKQHVVRQAADRYIEPTESEYGVIVTVKDQVLAVNAGVDESNADGKYVLLPEDSYASAEKIWRFLKEKHQIEELGVIITDSRTFPLKWGVMGTCLAHCGFKVLDSKIGELDLFGHEMQMTQVNVAEGLAVAAVLNMGESNESQPIAVVTEVEQLVQFQAQPPSAQELKDLLIDMNDDVFAPFLLKAEWKKGGGA